MNAGSAGTVRTASVIMCSTVSIQPPWKSAIPPMISASTKAINTPIVATWSEVQIACSVREKMSCLSSSASVTRRKFVSIERLRSSPWIKGRVEQPSLSQNCGNCGLPLVQPALRPTIVGSYGDRNGANNPDRTRISRTVAATIAARCLRNRAQISWPCEAVKQASLARRSMAEPVSTMDAAGPVVSARLGFIASGFIGSGLIGPGVSGIGLPRDALADARVERGQKDVGQEIQRDDGRGQQEDDRPGRLLVVRPGQRFHQKRAGIGRHQDQRDDSNSLNMRFRWKPRLLTIGPCACRAGLSHNSRRPDTPRARRPR